MKDVLFVALDVDDKAFHTAAITPDSGEFIEFSCKPEASALAPRLRKLAGSGSAIKVCYEATYLGFSLKRALEKVGIACEVISPAHIPVIMSRRRKTDRLDARKMVEFYKKGLLTVVTPPGIEEELDRDLLRSRRFAVTQMTAIRRHILSICRRLGWDFRGETNFKAHWTKQHVGWLAKRIEECTSSSLKINLKLLFRQLRDQEKTVALYNEEIANLASSETYAKKVAALTCFRGFDEIAAMTVVVELGDIRRFDHPRRIVSYAGLDITESSSGGKERKFHITKAGNRHLRTALVESCQSALLPVRVSKVLATRRHGAELPFVDIADRCMVRLHKKGSRLLYKDKPRNKIKTACARELIGFVWESLRTAS